MDNGTRAQQRLVERGPAVEADGDQIEVLTRAVNGGLNGIAGRKAALARAKVILL